MLKKLIDAIEGVFLIAVNILCPLLYLRRARSGATDGELAMELPGGDLVPNPRWKYTRAVTINAPAEQVWPWVVQLGQGRGGFYSCDLLENIVGCKIHSTDVVLPEFQELQVGDRISIHPSAEPLPVHEIERGKYSGEGMT